MIREISMKNLKFAIYAALITLISIQVLSKTGFCIEDTCQSTIQKVHSLAAPYNNISEISSKIPSDSFDKIDSKEIIQWIKDGFKKYPPGKNSIRDLLFTGLDVAAIAGEKEKYISLYQYSAQCTRDVYHALESSIPSDDHLIIYKLYNEGTILSASDICIGIDIVLENQNDDLAAGFAQKLDALLISHSHGDHFDTRSQLHAELKKANKPIVITDDQPSAALGDKLLSGQIGNLKWISFKGGHVDLNFSSFFLLTIADKWKVIHSGDNTRWLEFAKSEYANNIDVFLLKPESMFSGREGHTGIQEAMIETLQRIHPRYVIPHHLLELGHGKDAYGHDMGLRLSQQAPSGVDVVMLQWGEALRLPK